MCRTASATVRSVQLFQAWPWPGAEFLEVCLTYRSIHSMTSRYFKILQDYGLSSMIEATLILRLDAMESFAIGASFATMLLSPSLAANGVHSLHGYHWVPHMLDMLDMPHMP